MIGKQAKVLSSGSLKRLLAVAGRGRQPDRDRLIVLLSARAGLRACEIARLTWGMVLDANGQVGATIDVRGSIAKRGSGRRVPMHPELRRALAIWLSRQTRTRVGACPGAPTKNRIGPDTVVLPSVRGGGAMRPNSIVNWFVATCHKAGLEGCSSHSGRRTFITNAARKLHRVGASLRDVQTLAGHRSIETTQGYIDGDTDAQRRLVKII